MKGWCALLGGLVMLAAAMPACADVTLVMIRHGEKPEAGLGQLSCQGLNRALALPDVLLARFGRPAALYAPNPGVVTTDFGRSYNYIRPLATIEPTAIRLGLPVDTRWGLNELAPLEQELLGWRPRRPGAVRRLGAQPARAVGPQRDDAPRRRREDGARLAARRLRQHLRAARSAGRRAVLSRRAPGPRRTKQVVPGRSAGAPPLRRARLDAGRGRRRDPRRGAAPTARRLCRHAARSVVRRRRRRRADRRHRTARDAAVSRRRLPLRGWRRHRRGGARPEPAERRNGALHRRRQSLGPQFLRRQRVQANARSAARREAPALPARHPCQPLAPALRRRPGHHGRRLAARADASAERPRRVPARRRPCQRVARLFQGGKAAKRRQVRRGARRPGDPARDQRHLAQAIGRRPGGTPLRAAAAGAGPLCRARARRHPRTRRRRRPTWRRLPAPSDCRRSTATRRLRTSLPGACERRAPRRAPSAPCCR